MNELTHQINEIERIESILNIDLDILANCYISNTMHAHLKVPDEFDGSYNTLVDRLVQRIQIKNRHAHININNVMTYMDYYFNFS